MARTLILLAHPNLKRSRANRLIKDQLLNIPETVLVDLYEEHPYFYIPVAKYKALLKDCDHVVVQCPLYWYSVPALLKLWFDEVLELDFAYGTGGDALKGKSFFLSMTVGGDKEAYCSEGDNRLPLSEYLKPLKQTALICNMNWLEPCVLFGAGLCSDPELLEHAQRVQTLVRDLTLNGYQRTEVQP